ncbi:hypothetical protein A8135_01120 [Legionella jamestowniensis]|uniref:Uncharacterized protein n=1 Tax=Legionella jamestowniensis TaxID=455 RepID=A0ABX2XTC2_9GAMM|nr:hypothetical protein [Legionella jamestowniensis]OCH97853.1 hypothetical protein A8135_01120 [Legionella jamestowniensis]
MTYKTFADFSNINLVFGNKEEGLNYGYTATPNFLCEKAKNFENEYYLLYRRSEYAAQIELACAKIFKRLMGYGPEMEIVKEKDEFYIASRKIRNFVTGCPQFKNSGEYEKFYGLASVWVIWYFLCQSDTHSGNYGTSTNEHDKLSFGLDMAEALDFKMMESPDLLLALKRIPYIVEEHFFGVSEDNLPRDYVASKNFQNEKKSMIRLVGATSFDVFESIIREVVTSDYYTHQKVMMTKLIKFNQDPEVINSITEEFSKIAPEQFSVNALIQLLKNRHQQWQQLMTDELEQDFSLASSSIFVQEMNRYHQDDSESDEESTDIIYSQASYPAYSFFPKDSQLESEVLSEQYEPNM